MDLTPLVERAAADPIAFRKLVIRCNGLVRAICLAHSGNDTDAEDLVQEVFVRIYTDLPDLRDADRFLPWMRRVATNVCRMWLRQKRKPTTSLEMVPEPEDVAARERQSRNEVSQVVRDVLARVSTKSREVLALRYLAGCSEAEIAEVLALAPSTVKSRLFEGRKQAKTILLPAVEEFLRLETRSDEIANRVMQRCGSPGCICPDTLTEGR
jgi:RNA polymerase sigma-70 factor (ECF subfamily)